MGFKNDKEKNTKQATFDIMAPGAWITDAKNRIATVMFIASAVCLIVSFAGGGPAWGLGALSAAALSYVFMTSAKIDVITLLAAEAHMRSELLERLAGIERHVSEDGILSATWHGKPLTEELIRDALSGDDNDDLPPGAATT